MKKVLKCFFACSIIVISLISCSNISENTGNININVEQSDQRVIRIATSGTSANFSQIDPQTNEWTGVDAKIWDEIKERTGWEIELKQVAFDSLIGELNTGRVDLVSNFMEATGERKEEALTSIPYCAESNIFIINKERKNDFISLNELSGGVVGIKSGAAVQPLIENEYSGNLGFETRTYQENSEMYNDLAMNRTDAIVSGLAALSLRSGQVGKELIQLGDPIRTTMVTFFYSKTDEGKALKEEIDFIIQEMLDDGTIARITTEELGRDLTESIVKNNL